MKKFVLISIILVLFNCKQYSPDPTELYNKYRSSVTLIKNSYFFMATFDNGFELYYIVSNGEPIIYTDKEEVLKNVSTSYGTGFFISEKGEIATNNHVVYPDREAKLIGKKINEYFHNLRLEIQNEISDNKLEKGRVSDFYNSYYSTLEYYEKERLQKKYHDLDTKNIELNNLIEKLSFKPENTKIEMIRVFLGVIYDDTHITSDSDFDECVPIKKSDSESTDLAIIQLKNKKTPLSVENFLSLTAAEKNKNKLSLNDNVYMIGFNHGFDLASTENGIKSQFTQGTVTQDPDINKILYSIPTLPGSSGSPIIDKWGNLVAVNFAKTSDFQGFSFGIPVKKLIGLNNGDVVTKTENIIKNKEQKTKVVDSRIDLVNVIKLYLEAEESRDFNTIFTFFSSDLKRYWNLNYPSYSELERRYMQSWDIISNSKNYINKIEKINDSIYDLYINTTFEYYHINQKKTVSADNHVRYFFNENGKINQIYGIEKKPKTNSYDYNNRLEIAEEIQVRLDDDYIAEGKYLFTDMKCNTCHHLSYRNIGPSLMEIKRIYDLKGGDLKDFLKGYQLPIVENEPGQVAIMKSIIDGVLKDLNDDQFTSINSYILDIEN